LTIVLTGGGSGGHITPVLAVAAALKSIDPTLDVIYVGQKGDSLADIPRSDKNIDRIFEVRAGKFRRYHGEGFKQLLDVKTIFMNLRDSIYVIIGIYQSWRLMKRLRPNVLFSRGGFVSVPVALGAKFNKVPYITHDSDITPSLANKIIAKWARYHAVTFAKELYPYQQDKTITSGIPLNENFVYVTESQKRSNREELKIPQDALVLFVIGGGLGSQDVNYAVADIVPHLLYDYPQLFVYQSAGRNNDDALNAKYDKDLDGQNRKRVKVFDYIGNVYTYSGAADLIITRAGATNLAEFAVQGKACVVMPSSFLAGGHQLKNAQYLSDKGAAEVITIENIVKDPNRLARLVDSLLKDEKKRLSLGKEFAELAQPNAALEIAKLILEIA